MNVLTLFSDFFCEPQAVFCFILFVVLVGGSLLLVRRKKNFSNTSVKVFLKARRALLSHNKEIRSNSLP